MSLIVATLALQALNPGVGRVNSPDRLATTEASPSPATIQPDARAAALDWLTLVDQSRWHESWSATGRQFRELNTAQTWASLSVKVRVPLGAVLSREEKSQEFLPAPPRGYLVLKFRTNFATKPDTAETVTLVREDGAWRVVGYLIG